LRPQSDTIQSRWNTSFGLSQFVVQICLAWELLYALMLARICSRLVSHIRPSMTSTSFRGVSSEHRARLPKESGSIRLTDLEKQICTLLDDFTRVLREDSQDVECCIAGGWVRDKVALSVHGL
jgi:hypothetical protein